MTHRYPPSSSTSGEHINYELSQELLDELSQPSGPYNSSDFLDTYSQYFVDPRLLLGSGERPSTPLGSISVFGNRPGIMDSHPSSGADTPPSEHEELSISSASSSKQPSSNTTPATTRSSSYASVENIMPSLLVPAPIHLVRTRRPGLNSSSSSTSRLGHKPKSKEGKSRSSRSADAVSSSSTLLRRRASSPSAASTAEYYSSAERSLKLRIPKRLPAPQFRFSTNPHVDVVRHLRRIGLEQHAETAQQDQWLAVYVRDRMRQMTTSSCWRIAAQTSGPDTDTCGALASVHVIQSDSGSQSSPPSHVLALLPCGSERSGGTASQQAGSSSSSSAAGHGMAHSAPILLPVHALIYGVQCYHIPDGYFHSSRMMIDEDTVSHDGAISVPVLRLHLPHPATFSITHEYLYSGSPQKLLINLIPVRLLARGSHVAGSWTAAHNAHQTPKRTGKQRSKLSDGSIKASDLVPEINTMPKRETQASSSSSKTSSTCKREEGGEEEAAQDTDRLPDTSKLNVQEQMVQALSFLPTSRLIDITVLIHSVWLNGAAVGLADRDYWNTLACAWDYVYQALALAQKRAKYCEDRKLPADLDLSRLNVASGV